MVSVPLPNIGLLWIYDEWKHILLSQTTLSSRTLGTIRDDISLMWENHTVEALECFRSENIHVRQVLLPTIPFGSYANCTQEPTLGVCGAHTSLRNPPPEQRLYHSQKGRLHPKWASLQKLFLPPAGGLRITLRIPSLLSWCTVAPSRIRTDWGSAASCPRLPVTCPVLRKRDCAVGQSKHLLSLPRQPSELVIYSSSCGAALFKKINLCWLVNRPLTTKLPDVIDFLLVFFH